MRRNKIIRRVGFFLSVLWAIFVIGVIVSEYFQVRNADAAVQECYESHQNDKNEFREFVPDICADLKKEEPDLLFILWFLIIPIFIIWLLCTLVYLSIEAVSGTVWAFRLLVVISGVWLPLSLVIVGPFKYDSIIGGRYFDVSEFLVVGIIPLAVFWGMIWVLKGVVLSRQ